MGYSGGTVALLPFNLLDQVVVAMNTGTFAWSGSSTGEVRCSKSLRESNGEARHYSGENLAVQEDHSQCTGYRGVPSVGTGCMKYEVIEK